jgi:nitrous oxide reductase
MIFVFKIKCDRMGKGWNYNICSTCERFTCTNTEKGWSWFCSLNTKERDKYHFFNLWATELAIKNGVMSELDRPAVNVTLIGKRN